MNLGKRIEARLAELKWSRNQLLDRVPELSAQALSNLIRRDSRRSEWDEQIAKALGVTVLWLVYGYEDQVRVEEKAAVYDFQPAPIKAVVEIMNKLEPERQNEVIAFAEERLTLQQINTRNSTKRAGQ